MSKQMVEIYKEYKVQVPPKWADYDLGRGLPGTFTTLIGARDRDVIMDGEDSDGGHGDKKGKKGTKKRFLQELLSYVDEDQPKDHVNAGDAAEKERKIKFLKEKAASQKHHNMLVSPMYASVASTVVDPTPKPPAPTGADEAKGEAMQKKTEAKEVRDKMPEKRRLEREKEIKWKALQHSKHVMKVLQQHDERLSEKMKKRTGSSRPQGDAVQPLVELPNEPSLSSSLKKPQITDCYEAIERLTRIRQAKDEEERKHSSKLAADMMRREVRVIEAYYSAKSESCNAMYSYLDRKGEAHRFEELCRLQEAALGNVEELQRKKANRAAEAEVKRIQSQKARQQMDALNLSEYIKRNEERLALHEGKAMERYEKRQEELAKKVFKERHTEPARSQPTYTPIQVRKRPGLSPEELERQVKAKEDLLRQHQEVAEAERLSINKEKQRIHEERLGAVLSRKANIDLEREESILQTMGTRDKHLDDYDKTVKGEKHRVAQEKQKKAEAVYRSQDQNRAEKERQLQEKLNQVSTHEADVFNRIQEHSAKKEAQHLSQLREKETFLRIRYDMTRKAQAQVEDKTKEKTDRVNARLMELWCDRRAERKTYQEKREGIAEQSRDRVARALSEKHEKFVEKLNESIAKDKKRLEARTQNLEERTKSLREKEAFKMKRTEDMFAEIIDKRLQAREEGVKSVLEHIEHVREEKEGNMKYSQRARTSMM